MYPSGRATAAIGQSPCFAQEFIKRLITSVLQEADEDSGTARLVALARKEIAAGMLLVPKQVVDRIASGKTALRAVRECRGKTQL